jgi:hypothetical protein
MNDEELEGKLRRYRPVDPPLGLRSGVLAGTAPRRRALQWLPATVAAAAIVVFSFLTADLNRRGTTATRALAEQERRQVEELSEMLGGGPVARFDAEHLITQEHGR